MEYVYHIVAIRVNETSWAHVWRLSFRYLGMGYDTLATLSFLHEDEPKHKAKKLTQDP
jgi:hypothetical protein